MCVLHTHCSSFHLDVTSLCERIHIPAGECVKVLMKIVALRNRHKERKKCSLTEGLHTDNNVIIVIRQIVNSSFVRLYLGTAVLLR